MLQGGTSMVRSSLPRLVLLSLVLALGACRSRADGEFASSTTITSARPLDDAQIAEAERAAIAELVDESELARRRATDPGVKSFALELSSDYQVALDRAIVVRHSLGLDQTRSAISQDVADDTNAKMQLLRVERAMTFDRAYLDAAIDVHEGILSLIRSTLLPATLTGRLRESLLALDRTASFHLAQAEQLRGGLAAATPAPPP